jgi:hypothetical protein
LVLPPACADGAVPMTAGGGGMLVAPSASSREITVYQSRTTAAIMAVQKTA